MGDIYPVDHTGDRRPFRVGENLAISPGQVVFRSEVLELIQYKPVTPRVLERPLVFIPPQINKFYILDLAPNRSLIEFAATDAQTMLDNDARVAEEFDRKRG